MKCTALVNWQDWIATYRVSVNMIGLNSVVRLSNIILVEHRCTLNFSFELSTKLRRRARSTQVTSKHQRKSL